MGKSILLAQSNLRRAKGQAAAILGLILFASFMLNLWLMLATDYKQNFVRCHNRQNGEHVTMVLTKEQKETAAALTETLKQDNRVADYSFADALYMVGSFAFNGGKMNSELVFLEKEKALDRRIGRIELVEEVEEGAHARGVYFPVLYRSKEIAAGKNIEITIGSRKHTYKVCGFFNSAMAGSHNCGLCAMILTKDCYQELEETGDAPKATLVSVRLTSTKDSEAFETMLNTEASEKFPDARMASNSYALVSQSRYISQMVCSGIISAAAFFVLLVALAVIVSNIVNYIQENMKNLGALKALGYTSRQLAASLLLQFSGLALLAALAGAGLSYCLFPEVNRMMVSQTGIPYEIHFLPLPLLCTLLIVVGAVALAVWLTARKIRKIEAITALRQGMQTHNFKKNHVPLDQTRAPLLIALSLKNTCSNLKQNLTVCITMMMISLVVVFSGVMVENIIKDMTPFVELIVGETADSCINIQAEAEAEFLEFVGKDERVKKVYLYHSLKLRHPGGTELLANLSDDFSKMNNQKLCVEGRFPKYENETAVAAKYAKENGLKIGDEITLAAEGKEAKYLISGYTQTSNNLGKDCLLTRAGYERLGKTDQYSYYLNLAPGVDIDAFNEEIGKEFAGQLNAALNIRTIVDGSASVYVSLMKMIVAVVLCLSLIIIALVLYLLVRILLAHKKQEYGILKALGFTTGQLVLQTAASFLPAVAISTALGIFGWALVINPLTALFLQGIGIVKCTFTVPAGLLAAAGAGLAAVSFLLVCGLSLRIRRIAPCKLLLGEG